MNFPSSNFSGRNPFAVSPVVLAENAAFAAYKVDLAKALALPLPERAKALRGALVKNASPEQAKGFKRTLAALGLDF